MDLLKLFYENEHEKEAVKSFFFQELDKYALEKVYKSEDTQAIAEAKETIERAFAELEERYKKVKEVEIRSPR